jgi:DNA-binding HxlR family transcriptional regulator
MNARGRAGFLDNGHRSRGQAVKVTYRLLRRLEELASNLYDTMILTVLADGPLRFTEVSRALTERMRAHLADTQLTRCLTRLVEHGRVEKARQGRYVVYRLTAAGERDAATLRMLVGALEEFERPNAGRSARMTE